jgi:hypothetical protein
MSAAVDDLLQQHSSTLWRARERAGVASPATKGLPTGYAALDQCLPGGGWPRQGLIEILADRQGIGELSLLMPALAALCRGGHAPMAGKVDRNDEGGWLAWVAPPLQPYAPALAASGIDVRRVLVVRAGAAAAWAMEQALRSEACSAVLGWMEPRAIHTLRRLQLAAEQSGSLAVLFRRTAAANTASPAILRIALQARQDALEVRIVKSRGGRPVSVSLLRTQ